jgi:hypothetical protein
LIITLPMQTKWQLSARDEKLIPPLKCKILSDMSCLIPYLVPAQFQESIPPPRPTCPKISAECTKLLFKCMLYIMVSWRKGSSFNFQTFRRCFASPYIGNVLTLHIFNSISTHLYIFIYFRKLYKKRSCDEFARLSKSVIGDLSCAIYL